MTRIDHAAEAKHLIGATEVRDWNSTSPHADRRIATALTHATLALAEQQRIANLVAIVGLNFGPGGADVTVPWGQPADTSEWSTIRNDIAAALGIES